MADVCVTCRAPIRWAFTVNGKPMPLDPDPVAGGNVALDDTGRATVVPADRRAGPLYVAHFTTCPYAAEHRRRR
jgi:hypothetical protein